MAQQRKVYFVKSVSHSVRISNKTETHANGKQSFRHFFLFFKRKNFHKINILYIYTESLRKNMRLKTATIRIIYEITHKNDCSFECHQEFLILINSSYFGTYHVQLNRKIFETEWPFVSKIFRNNN